MGKAHLTLAGDLVVSLPHPLPTLLPALCPRRLAFRDHVNDLPCPLASRWIWSMQGAHGREEGVVGYLFPASSLPGHHRLAMYPN